MKRELTLEEDDLLRDITHYLDMDVLLDILEIEDTYDLAFELWDRVIEYEAEIKEALEELGYKREKNPIQGDTTVFMHSPDYPTPYIGVTIHGESFIRCGPTIQGKTIGAL